MQEGCSLISFLEEHNRRTDYEHCKHHKCEIMLESLDHINNFYMLSFEGQGSHLLNSDWGNINEEVKIRPSPNSIWS